VIVGTIAAAANAAEPAHPRLVVSAANSTSVLPAAGLVGQLDQLRAAQAASAAAAAQAAAAQAAEAERARAAAGPQPIGPSFTGMASWYGDETFDNRTTASGAVFRADGFTAASPTLPFGTTLHVCRGETCVDVVVTDRGPYVSGRVLDLSRGAARVLGMLSAGVAQVTATPVS